MPHSKWHLHPRNRRAPGNRLPLQSPEDPGLRGADGWKEAWPRCTDTQRRPREPAMDGGQLRKAPSPPPPAHRATPGSWLGQAGERREEQRVSPVPEGRTYSGHVWLAEAPPLRPPSPHGAGQGHRGAQRQTQACQQGGRQANSQQHACRWGERGGGPMVTTRRGPGEWRLHVPPCPWFLCPAKQPSFLPQGFTMSGVQVGVSSTLHPSCKGPSRTSLLGPPRHVPGPGLLRAVCWP